MHLRILRLLASAVLLSCGQGLPSSTTSPIPPPPPAPPPPPSAAVRLLFVGNSLTYVNDLPSLVGQMAVAAGFEAPVILSRAFPDFSLDDHWADGTARTDLATGHYTFVIMQQGPSTLDASGVQLTQSAVQWSTLARANGTVPALFVVWPPSDGNLDAGIHNYESAAAAAQARVFPAAEAWKEAWAEDPSMPLYSKDGFHPSVHGSWLSALVIASMVFDRPPAAFPNLFAGQITDGQEVVLRAAAARAITKWR